MVCIAAEADEVLEIRVLLDLKDGFIIAQVQLMLDNHRSDYQTGILTGPATISIHRLVVADGQFIPGDDPAPFPPSVVRTQLTAEGQVKSLQGYLPGAFVSDHVQAF